MAHTLLLGGAQQSITFSPKSHNLNFFGAFFRASLADPLAGYVNVDGCSWRENLGHRRWKFSFLWAIFLAKYLISSTGDRRTGRTRFEYRQTDLRAVLPLSCAQTQFNHSPLLSVTISATSPKHHFWSRRMNISTSSCLCQAARIYVVHYVVDGIYRKEKWMGREQVLDILARGRERHDERRCKYLQFLVIK